ncbi:DUF6263 family protein [Corynebacterium anserum]|uniref:Uncharacterized protein n=1 Tax=Corynebacterium anserum TaxID=2684406 RepID=A0A7G7YMZ8_9CORY|nr:DUF6263 family protein [Corynebacterium anserum]MBC2680899.1 hypothetical protein [Corynebacterium anserum]QNH95868.1 hypothetical protein GP473_03515 [Corynebacterium anserum]
MANRKTRRTLALTALFCLSTLTACGEDSNTHAQPVNAPVEGVTVQLLNAGEGSAQPLVWFTGPDEQKVKFSFTQGLEQKTLVDEEKLKKQQAEDRAKQSATQSSDSSASTTAPSFTTESNTDDLDVPYDEVTMDLPLTTNIHTDGHVRTSTVTVGRPSGSNTERNEDVATAEGFTMVTEQNLNGRVQNRNFSAPESATDSARASVEQALTRMNDVPIIFPDEPIGVGGKWKVSNRIDENGTSMLQDIIYTLSERQNKTVKLGVEVKRRPATKQLADTDLEVLDVSSESTGHIVLNLTHALPERGSVKVTTTTTYGQKDSAVKVIQTTMAKTSWAQSEEKQD